MTTKTQPGGVTGLAMMLQGECLKVAGRNKAGGVEKTSQWMPSPYAQGVLQGTMDPVCVSPLCDHVKLFNYKAT